MWMWLALFIFASTCSSELVQIYVLSRHGDRAPSDLPYPKDPYNETFWPRGWDQLTEEGMQQTHALGKWLRKRYIDEKKLLSPHFQRNEILFRSSNADRAIESAQSIAAGLYPLEGSTIWQALPDPIGWQPIPIFSSTYGVEDALLRPTGVQCPIAKKLVKKETANLAESINLKYRDLFVRLANYTGSPSISFKNVKKLNGIYLEMLHGLAQPDWVQEKWNKTSIISHIQELKRITRISIFDTREKSKLIGGVLINDWAANLEATSKGFLQRKAFMFSAHDGTMNGLMYTLGIGNHLLVPYAAAVILELHKEETGHYVKFIYKNETDKAYLLTLPNCTELCSLKRFLESIADVRIEDLRRMKELCNDTRKVNIFGILIAVILSLLK